MPVTCPCSGGLLESTEVQLLIILAAGLPGWCAFRPGGRVKRYVRDEVARRLADS